MSSSFLLSFLEHDETPVAWKICLQSRCQRRTNINPLIAILTQTKFLGAHVPCAHVLGYQKQLVYSQKGGVEKKSLDVAWD